MIIERYITRSAEKIGPGKHKIEVDTTIAKPVAPAEVVLSGDSKEVARTTFKRPVPMRLQLVRPSMSVSTSARRFLSTTLIGARSTSTEPFRMP